jgi:fructose-1,6-bisphosphatase/inositol monophosphatase family enzyme
LPLFAVIVALVVEGETRIGWIHDPVSGRLAVASRGEGAWMQGRRLQVHKPKNPGAMTGSIYGRRFRQSDAVRRLWGRGRGRLGVLFNTRCVGQEYLARVQGRMHFGVYTRLNPWDHAAGILLHAEAGGYGALFDGSPYRPIASSPGVLLTPDKELWEQLHEQVIVPAGGA